MIYCYVDLSLANIKIEVANIESESTIYPSIVSIHISICNIYSYIHIQYIFIYPSAVSIHAFIYFTIYPYQTQRNLTKNCSTWFCTFKQDYMGLLNNWDYASLWCKFSVVLTTFYTTQQSVLHVKQYTSLQSTISPQSTPFRIMSRQPNLT